MGKAVGEQRMKERDPFLDKLRVMATCAVVLLHTMTGVMDITDMGLYPEERKIFMAVLDMVCWCVPVFLMISGYLFLDPGRQVGMRGMLAKYCRRIVLALFLFGVPYACLELIAVEGRFRFGMLGNAFLAVLRGEGWAHMWYLYLILFLYLATPLLKRVLGAVPKWTVYGLQSVLFLGCSVLPCLHALLGWEIVPGLPGDGIYFFYYICGYLFAVGRKKSVLWREGLRKAVRTGILPGLALALALGMAASRLSGEYVLRMAYNYPFTVVLALLLFAWGSGAEKGGSPFWTRAAELSFTIYLIHPVFLNLAYKLVHFTPLSPLKPLALSLPLFFTGTLLLSAAFAWILYRIPVLRKYVL